MLKAGLPGRRKVLVIRAAMDACHSLTVILDGGSHSLQMA